MATTNGQIASGIGHRETGAVAGPSTDRQRLAWSGGAAVARQQDTGGDDRGDQQRAGSSLRAFYNSHDEITLAPAPPGRR